MSREPRRGWPPSSRAPATGALFALEVPYQDDLAKNMLLPALVGAATGYITFAAMATTTPLLQINGAPAFDLRDLGGALVIGILAGGGARAFAALIRFAKGWGARQRPMVAAAASGVILGALIVAARAISDEPLAIGPGYRAVHWATDPTHGIAVVGALLLIRTLAVPVAVAGGGVGGLFIPLVVEGALIGRLCGAAFGQPGSSLFPVIGIAAFLGAGYRVPLAAVMFVAESTGRPEFVVPGLIAAVAAQLLMGRASVSAYQQARQAGHLERRFRMPISEVVQTDIATISPTATVSEFFTHLLIGPRRSSVAVIDGGRYVGVGAPRRAARHRPGPVGHHHRRRCHAPRRGHRLPAVDLPPGPGRHGGSGCGRATRRDRRRRAARSCRLERHPPPARPA